MHLVYATPLHIWITSVVIGTLLVCAIYVLGILLIGNPKQSKVGHSSPKVLITIILIVALAEGLVLVMSTSVQSYSQRSIKEHDAQQREATIVATIIDQKMITELSGQPLESVGNSAWYKTTISN